MKLLAKAAVSTVAGLLLVVGCGTSESQRAGHEKSDIYALGGTRLSEGEIAQHLRDAGFSESAIGTMVCIAKYESSFYSGATNTNSDGTTDYGLFQINGYWWSGSCGVSGSALLDPAVNTRCAKQVYQQQGFNAWYGYQYHRSECNNYSVASSGASSGGQGGSCDQQQLDTCLTHGGGKACYAKWGCG